MKNNRRTFLKKTLTNLSFLLVAPNKLLAAKSKKGKVMKKTLHLAKSRGVADHGWLKSKHSFSFASYYNPDRMGFGLLRIINDDQVAPKMGFGTHPHQDMEIISIPLSGALKHNTAKVMKLLFSMVKFSSCLRVQECYTRNTMLLIQMTLNFYRYGLCLKK